MFPESFTFSIADWVNGWVDSLVTNYGDVFRHISDTLLWAIVNLEGLLRAAPWWLMLAIVGGIAWHATRKVLTTAVIVGLLFLVGAVGLWDKLMQTLALMMVATVISVLIGIPLGILSARSNRLRSVLMPLLDIMQTMPSFVYLIPVLMLFRPGQGAGDFRHGDLRRAAADSPHRPGHSPSRRRSHGSHQRLWRQPLAAAVRRATAAGAAKHHGRYQPDHHDGVVDGGHRLDDRRAWLG